MRYNHFDMLPEKAFQPVGKRMTLEGGGGGLGNVVSTAGSLAAGQSPLGAFGGALGSQVAGNVLGGGGGGGGGRGTGGNQGGFPGIGTQNQTQIVGPFAGMNPASIAYKQQQQLMQDNRFGVPSGPQTQPLVQQPQVGATLFNGTVTPNTIGPNGLPVGGMPATQADLLNNFINQQRDLGTGGGGGMFSDRVLRAPDLSQDAYRQHLATALYRSQADIPSYEQWVQQRQSPIKQIPPYAQSVFADLARRAGGPQNLFNSTPVRPPVLPQNTPLGGPMAGLGSLMGQLQGGPKNFRGFK